MLVAGAALLVGAAGPASAKSISHVPATCSLGTTGYGVFMERGSEVTLGFGATGTSSAGTWHVLVSEGTTAYIDDTADMGESWTVVSTRILPRGFHTITEQADNLVTGETCSATVSFKN